MQFMCVGLLLSLTERFVYGSDANFFSFGLRRLLHPLYICQQISIRGASVIDYTYNSSLVSFALPVCEMCCPFCTCIYILGAHAIFIFKTFDFLEGSESSRWTDLTVSTRRRPSAT